MNPRVDDPNAKRRGSEAEEALGPGTAVEGDILEKVFSRLAGRSQGFGRYRLQGEVARGGMGVILNVWDEDLRRNLAMKVVLARDSSDSAQTVNSEGRRALARFLESEGRVVRLGDGFAISLGAYEVARDLVRREAAQAGEVTLARFRDLAGVGRRDAQLLLERMDVDGLTRRIGDRRLLRRAGRGSATQ